MINVDLKWLGDTKLFGDQHSYLRETERKMAKNSASYMQIQKGQQDEAAKQS